MNPIAQVVLTADESHLLVADLNNHQIRRISLATGAVTHLAGDSSGEPGFADGIGLHLHLPRAHPPTPTHTHPHPHGDGDDSEG